MRWVTAVLALTWALALLYAGGPRMIGSLSKAPAFSVVSQMHRGEPLSGAQLSIGTQSLAWAERWDRSARLRSDLGLLLLQRAAIDPESPDAERLRAAAETALRDGLARAPARTHAWVRLASTRMAETGPSPEIAAFLERSFAVGRSVPDVTLARAELLLRNWEELGTAVRIQAVEELQRAWIEDERQLVDVARHTRQNHIVRFALRDLPGAAERFDAAVAQAAR